MCIRSSGICFALIQGEGRINKSLEDLTMRADVLDKVADVSARAAQLGAEVRRVKESVVDVVDNRINSAKRVVKRGRRAAKNLVDDTEYQIKHHPKRALGVSLGVGLGLGAVIGVLLSRNGNGKR
jgi:ElaB/YqjD/DUF883 family membrane-anchored ribosome-binding protein